MILFLLILVLSIFFISRRRRLDNIFDPVILFYFMHLFFFGLGVCFEFLINMSVIETISFGAKFIPIINLLNFAILIFLLDILFKKKKETNTELINYFKNVIQSLNKSYLLIAKLFLFIGMLIAIYHFFYVYEIENFSDVENLRIIERQGIGWVSVLSISLISVSGMIIYVWYCNKLKFFYLIILSLFLSIFVLSYGFRGPAFALLIFCLFFIILLKKGKVTFLNLFFCLVFLLILFSIIGFFRSGSYEIENLQLLLNTVFWRTYTSIYNLDLVFSYLQSNDVMLGKSYLHDLSIILPGHQNNFALIFKETMGLNFNGGGVNLTYLGEFLINFGLHSIFINSTILFVIIYLISHFTAKDNFSNFILRVIFCSTIKSFVLAGLISPIINIFFPQILLFLLIIFISQLIRYSRYNYGNY